MEGIGDIHLETVKLLSENLASVRGLLIRVRGSQPEQTGKQEPKNIERTAMGDAHAIRHLAQEINYSLNELHQVIGYTK